MAIPYRHLRMLGELLHMIQKIGVVCALALLAFADQRPFSETVEVSGRRYRVEVILYPAKGIWIMPIDN
jgi:hypothetical protein